MTSHMRMRSSSAPAATTSTSAPSSARVSATAKPVTPRPSTAARRCAQGACQLVRVPRSGVSLTRENRLFREPLEVEQAYSGRNAESGNNPEANHNGDFRPALELKVMMNGAHQE